MSSKIGGLFLAGALAITTINDAEARLPNQDELRISETQGGQDYYKKMLLDILAGITCRGKGNPSEIYYDYVTRRIRSCKEDAGGNIPSSLEKAHITKCSLEKNNELSCSLETSITRQNLCITVNPHSSKFVEMLYYPCRD